MLNEGGGLGVESAIRHLRLSLAPKKTQTQHTVGRLSPSTTLIFESRQKAQAPQPPIIKKRTVYKSTIKPWGNASKTGDLW